MNCEIVNVGTELILGHTVNTNATLIARKLAEWGIDCYFQTSVGDNQARLVEALRAGLDRSDVLIVTGGLGSTDDDITREAIAEAFGRPLSFQPHLAHGIEDRLTESKIPVSKKTLRQAYLPDGAQPIPAAKGTAPGMILDISGKTVVALPGVPVEMEIMLDRSVLPYVRKRYRTGREVIVSRVLKVYGLREAEVEEKAADIIAAQSNPTIAPLIGRGEVQLRLTAKAAGQKRARELIVAEEKRLRERLGDYVFAADEETMESTVAELMRRHRFSLAVAESFTGGLVCSRLVGVPGSSDFFWGGVVGYANPVKTRILGVSPEHLLSEGAVSATAVEDMATGVRHVAQTDIGIASTGIAGPAGGGPKKPVGLSYFALSAKDALVTDHRRFRGDRDEIRFKASQYLLNMLRSYLLSKETGKGEPA